MANNLFVSCELFRPEQNYDRVAAAVKSVGDAWTKVQFSLWYLKTPLSARQVCDRVKPALDKNDQLVVIDATNNKVAWINLGAEVSGSLHDQGFQTVA